LERDFTTEREEEVVLTRESQEVEFRKPDHIDAIRRYQRLKTAIVEILAGLHAKGMKRVPAAVLLEGLCDDPGLTNRALNELVELKLIRELNHTDGMRLTAEGQKSAEERIANQPQEHYQGPGTSRDVGHFDFFISYASEDAEVAEALEVCLTRRGYKVWRDRRQLTVGDSLTAKINEGLATSRYGIVILSAAFLRKNWPRAELDALQARAISAGRKIILPLRRNLPHEAMAERLPLLGDKLTLALDGNLEDVADEIERAANS
jgi:hypothetical protein